MSNKKLMTILTIVVVAGLVFVYAQQGMFEEEVTNTDYGVEQSETMNSSEGYGVSASHPLAVEAGMKVLEEGGNAADAAVVVAYVLGTVEPYGSGIGGGGEMLIYPHNADEPTVYEYRETAPESGARPETFAIPGLVRGMEELNNDLGSMDMQDLIQPAIDYAEEGFEVDKHLVDRLGKGSYRMDVADLDEFFPNGEILEVNDRLVQPELAETLRLIQEDGADAFYDGPIADQILEHEETLKAEDLSSYAAATDEAAHGSFAGYDVYSAPPPLAGVTLIQSLQMAEQLNVASTEDNQRDYIHLIGEISKRSYDDRVQNVGDTSFTDTLPTDELTSADYTQQMADTISLDELSEDYEVNDSVSDEEDHDNTTHFVIIDQDGTMVSATHTLGNFFGSGDNVAGFFMNNQMENFSTKDDSLNSIEPGKTPRSFTSPTILTNGEKMIGIGSPGGKRIPMVMTQVLVKYLMFDEPFEDAVEDDRFYIEGNDIFTETELDKDVQSGLRARGYEIYNQTDIDFYGGIQSLVIDEESNSIYGAADSRRNGVWQADTNN
ncbi:gamma-glutamyltransferase family protein [Oceanobacillus neutriphilus]|uniref:Gamma-glutamyltranspeptidase n=1 Tax=Oceanobacillus neutriphilus TaxID=531815 RepID=A0ABQ2NP27_9BACI|nr:gamma-glutamyltransferase [Oceanobacillus neutriphilus]GGP08217.1 gamma-glutamyltranspeptidase [Oceanobacillus neutriphilus]